MKDLVLLILRPFTTDRISGLVWWAAAIMCSMALVGGFLVFLRLIVDLIMQKPLL